MNSNYSVTLKCKASYEDKEVEFEFDPYNDGIKDDDALKEMAKVEFEKEFDDFDENGEVSLADINVTITDWDDIPDGHDSDIDSAYDFCEAWAECSQDKAVVVAALKAGVSPRNIDESFSGEFTDDAAFAEDMADSLGLVDINAPWPMNYIDWEQAANDLMMDYMEEDGFYFMAM